MVEPRPRVAGYTPLLQAETAPPREASCPPLEGCAPVLLFNEAFAKHSWQSSATAEAASGWMFATAPEPEPWWEIDLGKALFVESIAVWLAPLPAGTEVRVVAYAYATPRGEPGAASFAVEQSAEDLPVAVEGSSVLDVGVGSVARHVRVTLRGPGGAPVVLGLRGAEILAASVFGETLLASFARAYTLFADRPLFLARPSPGAGRFAVTHLYRDVWGQARCLAAALAGVLEGPGDERVFLGLCTRNRAEWVVGELAAVMRGYVVVPLSPDDTDERLGGILDRCPLHGALVEGDGAARFARLAARCPSLRLVVSCDPTPEAVSLAELSARDAEAPPARRRQGRDLFTLLFTSGSTGVPKGAMRSYETFLAMIETYGVAQPAVHLSFQPLSHLSERMYLPAMILHGARIGFSGGGAHLLDDLRALEPTEVGSVPRLFEIVHAGHLRRLEAARAAGSDEARVWAESRAVFGGRLQIVSVGSAPCGPEVLAFLKRCFADVWVTEGYGSTECGTITADGRIMHDVEVKLVPVADLAQGEAERGEIWVRTPFLIDGYFGDAAATAASRDAEGFFGTGDLGERTADGGVRVVGRLKNVIKLGQGEFVAVDRVEAELASCPLVDQVFVHPDETSSALLAVVVPRFDALAAALGAGGSPAELAAHPGAAAAVARALRDHGRVRGLAGYELPRAVLVAAEPMTVEAGLLTASGKLARPAAVAHFGARLAALGRAAPIAVEGDSLEARLGAVVSRVVGRRVDAEEPLHEGLGLDSLVAAEVLRAAGEALGRDVPLGLWFASQTLADLARRLDRGQLGSAVAADELPQRDLDLEPGGDAGAAPARVPAEVVLLTGATGLLGAHLLEALAARTGAKIVCLVRAGSDEAAADRVRATLARFEIPAIDPARWSAVAGDLGAPQLGLEVDGFAALAARVDAIVHCGATVSWLHGYEALRAPNVLGTNELLRLSGTARVKPFHFVSTISTAPGDGDEATRLPFEQARAGGGYGLTKWVAEALVRRAGEHGLPVAVYRPAMIAGHSRRGRGNPDDYVNRYLRACVEAGRYLDAGERIDMTPVDYVAAGIVALLIARPEGGATYHLTNLDQSMTYAALGRAVQEAGVPCAASDYAGFRAAAVLPEGSALRALAAYFPEGGFGLHMGPWPSGETRRVLAGLGVVCPRVDGGLIATYLAALRRR